MHNIAIFNITLFGPSAGPNKGLVGIKYVNFLIYYLGPAM